MTDYDRDIPTAAQISGLTLEQPEPSLAGKGARLARLSVRVHPRSSRNELRVGPDGQIRIWTTAAPTDGKANDSVRRLIAEWLGVAPSDVRIAAGRTGRTKIVDVPDSPALQS